MNSIPLAEAQGNKIRDVLYQHRYRELDGLRGIAALTVGLFHSMTAIFSLPPVNSGHYIILILAAMINGTTAVDLFFVMSGFFLTGMLEKVRLRTVLFFYARRLIRLAPPAMLSVVVFYIYARTSQGYYPTYPLQPEFPIYYQQCQNIGVRGLVLNLLLIHHDLNFVLWTIRIEILASLLFPLLFYFKNRNASFFYRSTIFVFLYLLALGLRHYKTAGLDVFQYLYIFYAGALARDFGARLMKAVPRMQSTLCLAAAAGVLMAGFINIAIHTKADLYNLTVTVFGSLLAASLAFGSLPATQSIMRSSIIQFFGRISYSYYLINWLFVLNITNVALYFFIPSHFGVLWAICFIGAVSTLICIPAAYLFHFAFEQPSVALSRRFARLEL